VDPRLLAATGIGFLSGLLAQRDQPFKESGEAAGHARSAQGDLSISPRRIALNSALEENSMPSPKRAQRDFFGATRRAAALSHPAEVGTSLERPEVLAQRFAAQERYDRSRRAVDRDQEAEATPQTRSMASQPAPKENISDQASPEWVWWTEPPPMSATLQMWDKYLAAIKSSPKNLLTTAAYMGDRVR
jgi:hypothetical protein